MENTSHPTHQPHHETHHESQQKSNIHMVMIALGAIAVLLLVYIAFIKRDSLWLETMKAGGADNMELVQKLYDSDSYKSQQAQAIQQALGSLNQKNNPSGDEGAKAAPEAQTNTIDKAKVDAIKKSGYIKGKENARITILEYSDFICPFCKRQEDSKVMQQLLEKYPNDVNFMYRSFIVHPAAKIVHLGLECVGELGGADKYNQYVTQAFALQDQAESSVVGLATTLGVNVSKFNDCLKSDKYSAKLDTMSQEGRTLFGVTGTPGNVVIDNQKGTYTLIAGAYPVETFIKAIDEILK